MAETHLTKEEELELGKIVQKSLQVKSSLQANSNTSADSKRILSEGKRAADKLISSYSSLVWSRARHFKAKYPAAPDLEDLAQEGFIGLVTAVEKYDPERGNKLSTVAYYWIDQAIGRSTNKTGRLIRLPENRITDFVKIGKIRAEFDDSDLSTDEVDEIIMEELDLSQKTFRNILAAGAKPTSLNRPVSFGGDGDSKELMDVVADQSASQSTEDRVAKSMMTELLEEKLLILNEMERAIVSSSFLLGSVVNKRASVAEVREAYNLSPQKFKRILNGALTKIRSELERLDISFNDFLE